MEEIIDITLAVLLPLLATVLTTIAIPAAVGWLEKNKIVADEARMKILQSALENAAMTALARVSGSNVSSFDARTVATDAAVAYVRKSVPDAVRKLGLDNAMINDLVMPHIERAIRESAL